MNNKISMNIIKKNNLIIFILLALGVFHIACHAQNDDTDADKNTSGSEISGNQDIHKSFNVQKGQKLTIDLKTGGSISITGWENNEVNINANFGGHDRNDIVVEMGKNSSGLEITSKYKHQHDSESGKAHFDIKVPYKFNLDINTMGGELTLEGVDGKITGQTMGGGLTLSHLKGYLDLSTMGGNISLKGSEVDGKVHTMGGIVEFDDVTGDVNGSSMGGQVIMKNVRRKNGVSKGDEVNISSMGGSINVDEAPEGANVSTMGGEINVHSVNKFIKAKTMGGNIKIDDVNGNVDAVTMGGDINVKENCKPDDIGRDIELNSAAGDITLLVPDGFSMDIDITITITKNRHIDYKEPKIISDFDIDKAQSDNWQDYNSSPKKFVHGKANINGGRNKVKIETTNGIVYLKKLD